MHKHFFRLDGISTLFIFFILLYGVSGAQTSSMVEYGCSIDAEEQIKESRALAKDIANPSDPGWRGKGDIHRKYHFPAADAEMPYRLYVPSYWDGKSSLPLVVFLHGAGSDENWYLDANDRQLIRLAEQHGYILLSPLGHSRMGAYGTPLRLPAVFGMSEDAAKQRASVTPEKEKSLQLSEKDIINTIEIVLNEYPVDRSSIFLAGHSMGSGGTWYLGAKYAQYFAAIAPMSGPFVDEKNYPWDNIRNMPVFMTEGTGAAPSHAGSKAMFNWMKDRGFKIEYKEVDADHGRMIPLVLPSIFNFFDRNKAPKKPVIITEADCTAEKLGSSIPVTAIGEPVSGVILKSPLWTKANGPNPGYCTVDGSISPVSKEPNARPINFRVALPASYSYRAAQMGGAGMNGFIPNLTGGTDMSSRTSLISLGFATYGSDSGHSMGPMMGFAKRPAKKSPGSGNPNDWTLNEEAIKNLGYMQMKKTHDAAVVLMERAYGEKPQYNYFFGGSQGGREALTVAQRYPEDYNGIAANVPIVNFSSLMLAPELIRIHEKPLENWVTPAKTNAIANEFIRQCDKLDGLSDGIINNYMACRDIFDVKQGNPGRNPWKSKRCPDNKDPNPSDTSASACLTDGQIDTLEFVYSRYEFATPLANNVKSFGMWLPNTDPSGSGLIEQRRYKGQEGADENAPVHSHLGVLGVTGFLMQDLKANPLDYVEGGEFNERRKEISLILDSTDPDLSAFLKRGGKMIVAIGTNDTLASPGAQLDYYQSVIDKMGRNTVDSFARFFVLPQANHGLMGTNYPVNGDGKSIPSEPIPTGFDRFKLLTDWVEKGIDPPMSAMATGGNKSLPMCSYPTYPKYKGGPVESAESFECVAP
jgi:poly(3-hydroxybutyrate) depolymerase